MRGIKRLYKACAKQAISEGISSTDEASLLRWIRENCNYKPEHEFFLFLGIGAAIADSEAVKNGYKNQVHQSFAKALEKHPDAFSSPTGAW
jgi:hypothetical protein